MKWIIRNGETEDVLERFDKDGFPKWTTDDRKAKWFLSQRDVEQALDICRKCDYMDSIAVSEAFEHKK